MVVRVRRPLVDAVLRGQAALAMEGDEEVEGKRSPRVQMLSQPLKERDLVLLCQEHLEGPARHDRQREGPAQVQTHYVAHLERGVGWMAGVGSLPCEVPSRVDEARVDVNTDDLIPGPMLGQRDQPAAVAARHLEDRASVLLDAVRPEPVRPHGRGLVLVPPVGGIRHPAILSRALALCHRIVSLRLLMSCVSGQCSCLCPPS